MDICHLKNAELETKHQKYKGRVVFRGDIVNADSVSYAVFTEQGSSILSWIESEPVRGASCLVISSDWSEAHQVASEKDDGEKCEAIWRRVCVDTHRVTRTFSSAQRAMCHCVKNTLHHRVSGHYSVFLARPLHSAPHLLRSLRALCIYLEPVLSLNTLLCGPVDRLAVWPKTHSHRLWAQQAWFQDLYWRHQWIHADQHCCTTRECQHWGWFKIRSSRGFGRSASRHSWQRTMCCKYYASLEEFGFIIKHREISARVRDDCTTIFQYWESDAGQQSIHKHSETSTKWWISSMCWKKHVKNTGWSRSSFRKQILTFLNTLKGKLKLPFKEKMKHEEDYLMLKPTLSRKWEQRRPEFAL